MWGIERRHRGDAFAVRFEMAGAVAAVARLGVSVVALLAHFDDSVAAVRVAFARAARSRAEIPGLNLASGRAAISRNGVSVVAGLARFDDAVAAHRRGLCLRANRRSAGAGVPSFDLARRGAAVAGHGVSVVAALAAFYLTVPASDGGHARLPRCRAREARLDLADAGASVAGDGISVVAGFAGLQDSIAAHGPLRSARLVRARFRAAFGHAAVAGITEKQCVGAIGGSNARSGVYRRFYRRR